MGHNERDLYVLRTESLEEFLFLLENITMESEKLEPTERSIVTKNHKSHPLMKPNRL